MAPRVLFREKTKERDVTAKVSGERGERLRVQQPPDSDSRGEAVLPPGHSWSEFVMFSNSS